MGFEDILQGLQGVVEYLRTLESFSFLNDKLPVLNLSVSDLVKQADSFADKVQEFANNPVGAIQEVEELLEDALGIPDTQANQKADSDLVEVSFANSVLRIDLTFETGIRKEPFPLNFDLLELVGASGADFLEGISSLVDASGDLKLEVNANARFELDLGIDLTDRSSPSPVVFDSTGLTLDARVKGSEMNFTASAGPLGLFIKNGRAILNKDGDFDTNAPAQFTVGLQKAPTKNRYLLSDLIANLNDIVQVQLEGGVSVNLPIFFPTEDNQLDPNLVIRIPNLAQLLSGNVSQVEITAPDLAEAIQDLDFGDNLASIIDGLDLFLQTLQDALDGEVFGVSLPLIGDSLKDAATFIEDFRDDVLAELRDLVGTSTAKANPPGAIVEIQKALFNSLGPGGLDLLVLNPNFHNDPDDPGEDETATFRDVAFAPAEPTDRVQFDLHLQQELFAIEEDIGFDIGLPALGLDVDGKVRLELGFDFFLSFGVSRANGFYFDTSRNKELEISLKASVPGLEATGNLAFLQLDVTDDEQDPSMFVGSFAVDITDPTGDGRLAFADFSSPGLDFGEIIDAKFSAEADVNLDTIVSFGGNASFPSLRADFDLDWGFNNADPGNESKPFGDQPNIGFSNVRLDLGSFLTDFIQPIVEPIADVLAPLKPVLDILDARLPVLSDLGPTRNFMDKNRDGKVTLVEMAAVLGGEGFESAQTFIDAAQNILEIIELLEGLAGNAAAAKANSFINFGSFDLGNTDVRGMTDLQGVVPSILQEGDEVRGTDDQNDILDKFKDAPGGGFSLPFIENPASLFRLFLGQDVTLVTYDMPALNFGFDYSQFFSILGPLGVTLEGNVGVNIDLAFGYDTFGLREFVDSKDPLDLLDGLFISDRANPDGTGEDVAGVDAVGRDCGVWGHQCGDRRGWCGWWYLCQHWLQPPRSQR